MKKVTVLSLSLAGFIAGTTSALAAPDVDLRDKTKPAVEQTDSDSGHQHNAIEGTTEQDANTHSQE
ncbi:MAG: hypothetical protein CK426_08805 [Legionella sp.]|nr:MAG: hypothetical protein CK423_07190 [Legionella sp.]PJD97161.1 MAG: hypothetical protein CK426_08805 [Legionella sp.]